MNAEDLQNWASFLRWAGLVVTAIGLFLTFGSHWIADKLIVLQRTDKVEAQNRLRVSEKELENTKLETAELEKRLAPRVLTNEQRQRFLEFCGQQSKRQSQA